MARDNGIRERRVYDPPRDEDGRRVLVDRIWPRGVAKAGAPFDEWLKTVAPSTELRAWYGHVPERFAEFEQRYRAELAVGEAAADGLQHLHDLARQGPVTLLTATKDLRISHLAVLHKVLDEG